jgi:hypothetical protein
MRARRTPGQSCAASLAASLIDPASALHEAGVERSRVTDNGRRPFRTASVSAP